MRTIQDLEAVGVDFYLDQQHLDTTTATGKLLFHVTGAFSEFERSMIRLRVNAGLGAIKGKTHPTAQAPASTNPRSRVLLAGDG